MRIPSSSAALNANVLASTYCNSWIFSALDPEDPFNSMARAYTELFIVRSDEAKETLHQEHARVFQGRRRHLSRRQDLPEQLQLPLRHAPAPREAHGHSEPDPQRRSERPADDLRRADQDQCRGLHRAAAGAPAVEDATRPRLN
ncbi:MAG: hypothetical protein MZV70_12235 [Desulfobacterales bacterium]|nr:hypothetical protein [Desulfobacterales bacterium]